MLLGSFVTSSSAAAASVDAKPPEARRSSLLDWAPLVLLAFVSVKLGVNASNPVNDPDTWWHLRLGEDFRGSWSLAHPGSLSPFATRPWFATQWTLEVVASYVNEAFGLAAVSWLAGLGVVILSVAIYASCRQHGSVMAAALASAVALLGTSLSHGPRPQMASFIFLSVFTAAWLGTMDDLKPRWWLVPLTWLWACTHGMWFIGVLVGVVVVVGLVMDRRLGRRMAVRLSLVPVAGLIAAALTPVGPKLILAPLATSKMAGFITEWQPPRFSELVPALAALMIAVVVATWARSGHRRSWAEILLLAMAAGWIVLYYRTIAIGAVIAAPLVAAAIQSWLPADRLHGPKRERAVGLGIALAIVVGLTMAAPSRGPAPLETMVRINAALSRLPSGTVVYNDYELGGWLEWRHRNIAPVIDGMTDAYQVSYVSSYVKASKLEPGWHKYIDKSSARYALLISDTPLAAALMNSKEWRIEARESRYVLLRRTSELS